MKEKLRSFPLPLQRQLLIKAGMTMLLFFAALMSYILTHRFMMLVPYLIGGICFATNLIWLFWICASNLYLFIEGTCSEIQASPIRKRCKTIVLHTEKGLLRIAAPKIKDIAVGDQVRVYLLPMTLIYEDGCEHVLFHHLMMERIASPAKEVQAGITD